MTDVNAIAVCVYPRIGAQLLIRLITAMDADRVALVGMIGPIFGQ